MAPRLTNAGEFLGSPAYSAPELLRGGDPTPSSDRYAFAVTAFELLTGQLPHPGSNVAAVITHILTEPPVFPAGMSGDTCKVFRQALAQDPDERPGTLMEFLLPLVDAYPLDPNARVRVNELFRHDDHAGDIVPLRRLRPGPQAPAEPVPGTTSTGRATGSMAPGVRTSPVRPVPSYTLPSPVKIELEAGSSTATRPPSPRNVARSTAPKGTEVTALTMIKWFLAILVAGQILYWVYNWIHGAQGQGPV